MHDQLARVIGAMLEGDIVGEVAALWRHLRPTEFAGAWNGETGIGLDVVIIDHCAVCSYT